MAEKYLDMQIGIVKDYNRLLARMMNECGEVKDDEDTPLDMKEMMSCIDDVKSTMCENQGRQGHPRVSSGDRPCSMGRGYTRMSGRSQEDTLQDIPRRLRRPRNLPKASRSQEATLEDLKAPRRFVYGMGYFPNDEVRRPGIRPKASRSQEDILRIVYGMGCFPNDGPSVKVFPSYCDPTRSQWTHDEVKEEKKE